MKHLYSALSALLLSILVVLSVAVGASASDPERVHNPSPILDTGDMLSPAEEASLTKEISANHERYNLSFVIETIPSLNGQTIESVAMTRANELGVGDEDKDNGVLIFLSRDDRKIRFELGTGITSNVSDTEMKNIIDSKVTPLFKTGDYASGIKTGMTEVGTEYTKPSSDGADPLSVANWIMLGVLVFLLVGLLLSFWFGDSIRFRSKEEKEREALYKRLNTLNSFARQLKYSVEPKEYFSLPDEKTRLDYLHVHHREIADVLRTHYANKIPSTKIIDRSLYLDTTGFFSDFTGKSSSDSAVTLYKLTGKGFENMSINEANKRIENEKAKYQKILDKQSRKKERARKIWNAIPEPTRKALRKAKTQSDRLALLTGGSASDFAAHYALISSMFLSSSSGYSSGDSGSSSRSSGSSGSSYSSGSSDSGSYGGGSFDGGGGSGGW